MAKEYPNPKAIAGCSIQRITPNKETEASICVCVFANPEDKSVTKKRYKSISGLTDEKGIWNCEKEIKFKTGRNITGRGIFDHNGVEYQLLYCQKGKEDDGVIPSRFHKMFNIVVKKL